MKRLVEFLIACCVPNFSFTVLLFSTLFFVNAANWVKDPIITNETWEKNEDLGEKGNEGAIDMVYYSWQELLMHDTACVSGFSHGRGNEVAAWLSTVGLVLLFMPLSVLGSE